MFAFLKKSLRIGLISAVVLGTAAAGVTLLAGEGRTRAVVDSVHGKVIQTIDNAIDDPTAMRAQLRDLEREYPKRIKTVRGDLAELNTQIRQLEREKSISLRVVELAQADLAELEGSIQQVASTTGPGEMRLAAVECDGRVLSFDRARSRVNQIKSTRIAYANRAADAEHDLKYLVQQANRLDELLVQLENERAQFQTQIASLTRQVDAIARNDRLIELLDERNKTIEECSRYESVSLDHITGRLAEMRSRQEAELEFLANAGSQDSYEEAARLQLMGEEFEAQAEAAEGRVFEMSYGNELSVSAGH